MRFYRIFTCLIWLATTPFAHADETPPQAGHQSQVIAGWTVHVSEALLREHPAATERALELLTIQLREIDRVVAKPAVKELQDVRLWFSPEYPDVPPRAEYHPSADWLREHKRNPAMAKSVEFTNVRIFEAETKRMPNFTLHELAHAYHDRVLPGGFENDQLKAAYERARKQGRYERVEQRFGDGRSSQVRAYALSNPMEYFAESSEAYFSTNDFFPFNRAQLVEHDPEMAGLLQVLWSNGRKEMP